MYYVWEGFRQNFTKNDRVPCQSPLRTSPCRLAACLHVPLPLSLDTWSSSDTQHDTCRNSRVYSQLDVLYSACKAIAVLCSLLCQALGEFATAAFFVHQTVRCSESALIFALVWLRYIMQPIICYTCLMVCALVALFSWALGKRRFTFSKALLCDCFFCIFFLNKRRIIL